MVHTGIISILTAESVLALYTIMYNLYLYSLLELQTALTTQGRVSCDSFCFQRRFQELGLSYNNSWDYKSDPASLPDGSGCRNRVIIMSVLRQQTSHVLLIPSDLGYGLILTPAFAYQGCSATVYYLLLLLTAMFE
jgi:hypothetical protein